jgi:hypothetical protein
VVSRYPYETHDGSPSLKSESIAVGKEMVELLQDKVNVAGARVQYKFSLLFVIFIGAMWT